jgi:hypothetical protein
LVFFLHCRKACFKGTSLKKDMQSMDFSYCHGYKNRLSKSRSRYKKLNQTLSGLVFYYNYHLMKELNSTSNHLCYLIFFQKHN